MCGFLFIYLFFVVGGGGGFEDFGLPNMHLSKSSRKIISFSLRVWLPNVPNYCRSWLLWKMEESKFRGSSVVTKHDPEILTDMDLFHFPLIKCALNIFDFALEFFCLCFPLWKPKRRCFHVVYLYGLI